MSNRKIRYFPPINTPRIPSIQESMDDEDLLQAIKESMESLSSTGYVSPKSPPKDKRTTNEINKEIDERYEASLMIDLAKRSKEEEMKNMKSPIKKFSANSGVSTVLTLKIKTTNTDSLSNEFIYKVDKKEPIKTLINKIKFENKHLGNVKLTLPGVGIITCDINKNSIDECNIKNNSTLMATLESSPKVSPSKGSPSKVSPSKVSPPKVYPPKVEYKVENYPKDKLITFKVKYPGFFEKKYTFHQFEKYQTLVNFINYDFKVDEFTLSYPTINANFQTFQCNKNDKLIDCDIDNNIVLILNPSL